jgi:cob(I)alamin adenosyltransferase
VLDTASEAEHQAAAQEALAVAREKVSSGMYFLVVVDEVLNAISEGLLDEQLVLEMLAQRGNTHVVLTGRGVGDDMIAAADLVTECTKIKHPYDEGKLAVSGLDF